MQLLLNLYGYSAINKIHYSLLFLFSNRHTESAKTRSILNDLIAEAHEIRENQTFRQTAINQAKQLQTHDDEIVSGPSTDSYDL